MLFNSKIELRIEFYLGLDSCSYGALWTFRLNWLFSVSSGKISNNQIFWKWSTKFWRNKKVVQDAFKKIKLIWGSYILPCFSLWISNIIQKARFQCTCSVSRIQNGLHSGGTVWKNFDRKGLQYDFQNHPGSACPTSAVYYNRTNVWFVSRAKWTDHELSSAFQANKLFKAES